MTISNISFSYFYPNPNPKNAVKIEAKDARTGQLLGSIEAQGESEAIYNQKLLPSYVDLKKSTECTDISLPHVYVSDLKVEETARNQGVGSALMKRIVEHSQLRNYDGRVIVLAGNPQGKSSVGFYDKLGFVSADPFIRSKIRNARKNGTVYNEATNPFMCLKDHAIRKFKLKKVAKSVIR